MVRCVLIDDEVKNLENLKILLEDFCDNVQVLALCQNVSDGIEAIRLHSPDIVFLDIQMQRETGFDLLEKIAGTVLPDLAGLRRAHEPIEPVQFLPQFDGDLVAHHARVFPGLAFEMSGGRGQARLADGGCSEERSGVMRRTT